MSTHVSCKAVLDASATSNLYTHKLMRKKPLTQTLSRIELSRTYNCSHQMSAYVTAYLLKLVITCQVCVLYGSGGDKLDSLGLILLIHQAAQSWSSSSPSCVHVIAATGNAGNLRMPRRLALKHVTFPPQHTSSGCGLFYDCVVSGEMLLRLLCRPAAAAHG